uniref:Neur_chan_LBD domain-containing protein n=1 Tax=Steinernema glaseri TaxID=37863 RepID=A0A1I7ZEA5_9BILA
MNTRWTCSLLVSAVIVTLVQAQFDQECKWKDNVTDIDELAHHKYQVLEDCLFYKLSRDAGKLQGQGNALMVLPPTVAAHETLDIEVLNVNIRQMWMNEVWKEMHIDGYFTLSWKDRRLRWDVSDWKTDVLNVRSYGRVWVPDINSDKHQTSMQTSDYTAFQGTVTKSNGNITTRMEYRIQAHCDTDFTDFPDDKKHCCFTLKSTLYPHYIKYFLVAGEDQIDMTKLRTNWHIEEATMRQLADVDDPKAQVLQMCITARRRSATLRIELTIPVFISALLVFITPFFGKMTQQNYVKLFAILLQYMSFQFLVTRTPQVGMGDHVPKIYLFYVFTLIVTAISLVLTLLISALSRIERRVPPAHRFTLLASVLNSTLCCAFEEGAKTDGTSSKDYRGDWVQIHVALNNLISIVVMLAYAIGVIVISF